MDRLGATRGSVAFFSAFSAAPTVLGTNSNVRSVPFERTDGSNVHRLLRVDQGRSCCDAECLIPLPFIVSVRPLAVIEKDDEPRRAERAGNQFRVNHMKRVRAEALRSRVLALLMP